MLKLPNELMDHVDSLCDTNTRLLLRQTCRQWQVVARARFAAEHFGDRQYYFDAETLHDLVQITADQNLAPLSVESRLASRISSITDRTLLLRKEIVLRLHTWTNISS